MKPIGFFSIPVSPSRYVRAVLPMLLASLLVACGGGGEVVVEPPSSAVSTTSLRALPAEFLARKAVAYGPYRTATSDADRVNEVITPAHVKEDLELLIAGNFKMIRLFDSSDKVARIVLEVIRDNSLDMKVQLGAYVNGFRFELRSQVVTDIKNKNFAELDRAIALATDPVFRNIVLTVSVGNERLVDFTGPAMLPAELAPYIRYVRDRITQPVTTDDNWAVFANPPKAITDVIDFASLHTYAELDTQYPDIAWNFRQLGVAPGIGRAQAMMDAAMVETRRQYQAARDALDRKGLSAMPITIGETGWNAVDLGKLRFRAHPVNQKMYFLGLEKWAREGRTGPGPANVFYFEAFDEPWKQGDDKWGLFTVGRKARYVIKNLYAPALWAPASATEPATASLTDADAVSFVPPVVAPAISANKYTVYAEAGVPVATPGAGCVMDPSLERLDAFDGDTAVRAEIASTSAPGDATHSCRITPSPRDYGWGLLYSSATPNGTVNLSNFAADGTLNVSIQTSYAGKIEIGVSTDTEVDGAQEAYLQIGNGDFGYCNTGAWCQVSVPLSAFKAVNAKLDFRLVLSRFIIADRYSFTGKSLNSAITTPLNYDAVYWSRP